MRQIKSLIEMKPEVEVMNFLNFWHLYCNFLQKIYGLKLSWARKL